MMLFKKYPNLEEKIPHLSLGEFPTPVEKNDSLNTHLNFDGLHIKRDDLSGSIYGGNKVRKLEFIFGEVVKLKKKTVITFGLAGSNHVLATIIYARKLGLNSIGLLLPQKNSGFLKKTILADISFGGEIHQSKNKLLLAINLFYVIIKCLLRDRKMPYIIPPGGSSYLGNLGYVNAAFELETQILSGEISKPDVIYVPMGSSGTMAGLILGFKLLNLDIKVCGVKVTDKQYANEKKVLKLIKKTNLFLHKTEKNIPLVKISRDDYVINENYFFPGYGIFNNNSVDGINLFYNKTKVLLDGTYASKTFAAVRDDVINKRNDGKNIIFWNTYNSRSFSKISKNISSLPRGLRKYYNIPVQELDNKINCDVYGEY